MGRTSTYLLRRLTWVPLILLIVSFVTFALGRLGPGDPIRIAAGQFRDEEAFARVRHARGLDKPIWDQYVIYMKGVLTRGDLGESFRYQGRSVSEVLLPAMWRSFQYNSVVLVLTLFIGIPLGLVAARVQGTWADPAIISVLLFLQSLLSFITVPFLLLFFALKLGWLPANGWPANCNLVLPYLSPGYACIGVASKEAIIPIMALALPALAGWARYTRAFALDVLNEDYIRTARSKGIGEFQVLKRHVLRNALLPLSTMIAFSMVGLFEGSFFVETLTGIPGAGRLAFDAIGSRDYDMIMAIVLLGASFFVVMSIVVDIAYTFIDPRVRYGARSN